MPHNLLKCKRLSFEQLERRELLTLLSSSSSGEGDFLADDDGFTAVSIRDQTIHSTGAYKTESLTFNAQAKYTFDTVTFAVIDVYQYFDYTPPQPNGNRGLGGSMPHYSAPLWLYGNGSRVYFNNNWRTGAGGGGLPPPSGPQYPYGVSEPLTDTHEYRHYRRLEPGTYEFPTLSIHTEVIAGTPYSGGEWGRRRTPRPGE